MSRDAFLANLAPADAHWLQDQLAGAQDPMPSDWAIWYINSDCRHAAGCVPPSRLEQLAAALPKFQYLDGFWTWDIARHTQVWSNANLQAWLQHEYASARMKEWRGEMQDWIPNATLDEPPNQLASPTLTIERCGFRYLGLRSRAVHVNGFTSDGRVVVGLRSKLKSQDPGLFDNLTAGGISAAETIEEALRRELHEEASIAYPADPHSLHWLGQIHTCKQDGQVWHSETLVVCNLSLVDGQSPTNRDGEVQQFAWMTAPEAVERMRQGQFTRDGIISLAIGLGFAAPNG